MNELKNFTFEDQQIRVLTIEGEPWFVGKDVAEVLGYSNSRKAIADHVDSEDKGGNEMLHPWRNTTNRNYQRIWSLQLDFIKQITGCQKIQALGHVGSSSNNS